MDEEKQEEEEDDKGFHDYHHDHVDRPLKQHAYCFLSFCLGSPRFTTWRHCGWRLAIRA